jgi:hypothetical protein
VRAKGEVGRETTLVTHKVNLGWQFNGWAECTCNKPKLLHVPFPHVMASLSQVGVSSMGYISPFYLKNNIEQTWTSEFYWFMACGDFSVYNTDLPICLPPMHLLRHCHGKGGHPETRRIHNDMDRSEIGGPIRRCRHVKSSGTKQLIVQPLFFPDRWCWSIHRWCSCVHLKNPTWKRSWEGPS